MNAVMGSYGRQALDPSAVDQLRQQFVFYDGLIAGCAIRVPYKIGETWHATVTTQVQVAESGTYVYLTWEFEDLAEFKFHYECRGHDINVIQYGIGIGFLGDEVYVDFRPYPRSDELDSADFSLEEFRDSEFYIAAKRVFVSEVASPR